MHWSNHILRNFYAYYTKYQGIIDGLT